MVFLVRELRASEAQPTNLDLQPDRYGRSRLAVRCLAGGQAPAKLRSNSKAPKNFRRFAANFHYSSASYWKNLPSSVSYWKKPPQHRFLLKKPPRHRFLLKKPPPATLLTEKTSPATLLTEKNLPSTASYWKKPPQQRKLPQHSFLLKKPSQLRLLLKTSQAFLTKKPSQQCFLLKNLPGSAAFAQLSTNYHRLSK